MKWIMSQKSDVRSSTLITSDYPIEQTNKLLTSDESNSQKKRKLSEGGDPPGSPAMSGIDGLVSVEGIPNAATITCDNLGKIRGKVQCPDASKAAKRIRGMDKKELKTLQLQIAMISDEDGDRPIHVAVAHGNLKLVQKLCSLMLKAAISLDLTNFLRQTPLHLAVIMGNTEMVKLLLKYGASLVLRDRYGNSVIHMAVKSNVNKESLCVLLSHPQARSILNSMDHEGYSALHHAVLKNNALAVTCLYRSGADMNIVDGKSGRSVLVHAVLERNVEMVKLLLRCGACAVKVDYSGRSAFELALQSSNVQIIKLLEKHVPLTDYLLSRTVSSAELSPQRLTVATYKSNENNYGNSKSRSR